MNGITRWSHWLLIALAAGLIVWGGTAVVYAQPQLTPGQIMVSGTRQTTIERMLLLQTAADLSDLRFVPLDLPDLSGEGVLSAGAIQAQLPAAELTANNSLTLTLTIDLAGVASGEYQGEAQLWHSDGFITLPLTVRVKDPWLLPLLTLLVGVSLAVAISIYRAMGKPRDELLARVAVLQADMAREDKLDNAFADRIEAVLVEVEAALRAAQWEEARSELERGEAYWRRWRTSRTDWLAQFAFAQELQQKLNAGVHTPAHSRYMQTVARELTAVRRRAPEETPTAFEERLEKLADQFNRYGRLADLIDQTGRLLADLPAAQRADWRQKAADWQRRLDDLSPDDENGWQTLYDAVNAERPELERLIAENRSTLESVTRSGGLEKGILVGGILGEGGLSILRPPTTLDLNLADAGAGRAAGLRLRLFAWLGYALAVLFLAGAGFAELYIDKAAFGGNLWGDYLALLAWGFGAEASRAAVVDMLKGWGMPGA